MRICFFSRRFFPAVSGMSVYASNLLRELVRLGHDVTMISQYRGDEAGTRIYGGGPPPPVEGVKVIGLEALGEQSGGLFEQDIETMLQIALEEHARAPFDIFHAQYGYPNGLAALKASRATGKPNVISIQGGDGHWVGVDCCATHKAAITTVLDHAGALLIGADSFAREVHENHGTPLDRFTIVPGAVNTESFHPRADWKAGEFIDPQRPVLLYHGRVDRRKGALDMLDALAPLAGARAWKLIVSGIGPDSQAVADKVRELKLEDHVEIAGYARYEDTPGVYHRGDIFLSPTYAEGFSNTILEAMASGLPIVSCHAVGVVDCLRHDENGLLVQPSDIAALRAAIEKMLDEPELRKRLAEQSLREIDEHYAWPVIARQISGVYNELVGTAPDNDWAEDWPIDMSCRYRGAPHLL